MLFFIPLSDDCSNVQLEEVLPLLKAPWKMTVSVHQWAAWREAWGSAATEQIYNVSCIPQQSSKQKIKSWNSVEVTSRDRTSITARPGSYEAARCHGFFDRVPSSLTCVLYCINYWWRHLFLFLSLSFEENTFSPPVTLLFKGLKLFHVPPEAGVSPRRCLSISLWKCDLQLIAHVLASSLVNLRNRKVGFLKGFSLWCLVTCELTRVLLSACCVLAQNFLNIAALSSGSLLVSKH